MAALIQIKRRLGTAGSPAALQAGELAYNRPLSTPDWQTSDHSLFVGNGLSTDSPLGVTTLVSRLRQVELAGDQTITGNKTISIDNFRLTGGAAGNVVKTQGDGTLFWDQGTVSTGDSISGDGHITNPLNIVPATPVQIAGGTDDVNAITALGLRSVMGDTVNNLETTARTVVPAINELVSQIIALTGVVILIGVYQVEEDHIHPVAGSPYGPGGTVAPLPPASQDNLGWYLIVDQGGTPTHGALFDQGDIGSVAVGDWLLSNGEAWLHFQMHIGSFTASNIAVAAIPGTSVVTVQEALEELYAGGALHVATDNVSILGTGHNESPLYVGTVDGGSYM